MQLNEQEIINAVCLNMAERKQVQPTAVEVQLHWSEDLGFSAEVVVEGRSQYLVQANLLEAIERYMLNVHGQRVYRSQIELDLEDEIFARITA
ncbi:YxcD family protein [Paenibacillus sp. y28]|uniref:YxcD family protein n=1 Tax=Paenibacillus sp. y28 TaxID=3129110 RepID=UPI00301AC6EA